MGSLDNLVMEVPFNDLQRKFRSNRTLLNEAVQRVLSSGWYILGPEVAAFEAEFADYNQVTDCIGLANGTEAIEIALRALSIAADDEVITVPNAGMYSTAAIRSVGARPIFTDIDPATHTLDPACLPGVITSRTRAIIVTHLYGRMADIPAIQAIARQHQLALIEDCAQAHGAAWKGRKAGSWGDLGCFSFYPTKNLGALGDGGAIITSDRQLAESIRRLRQYGWTQKYDARLPMGRNSRLDELQAAVLRAQLPFLDAANQRRRQVAARYHHGLAATGLVLPAAALDQEHVFHLYVVRHAQRELLRQGLQRRGVGCDIHYPIPDHLQAACLDLGISAGALPHSEAATSEVLSLPCFPEITEAEIETVIQAVQASLAEIV